VAEVPNPSTQPEPHGDLGGFVDRSERVRFYRERAREILALTSEVNDEQRRVMVSIAAVYARLADEFECDLTD
jgi:hypothetical protein